MAGDESIDEEDDLEPQSTEERERVPNRVVRLARRLMDRKELAEDTKDVLYAVLSTSDKAKTEAVRLAAREVRNYLSELKLKEDLLELATSHSLEISISLKPLAERARGTSDTPATDGDEG
jgi:SpoVK/Ycf46/Vps4 family AAA+-type ATPase